MSEMASKSDLGKSFGMCSKSSRPSEDWKAENDDEEFWSGEDEREGPDPFWVFVSLPSCGNLLVLNFTALSLGWTGAAGPFNSELAWVFLDESAEEEKEEDRPEGTGSFCDPPEKGSTRGLPKCSKKTPPSPSSSEWGGVTHGLWTRPRRWSCWEAHLAGRGCRTSEALYITEWKAGEGKYLETNVQGWQLPPVYLKKTVLKTIEKNNVVSGFCQPVQESFQTICMQLSNELESN